MLKAVVAYSTVDSTHRWCRYEKARENVPLQVKQVSLHFSGRMLVMCVPHSQDPGRLYAFSRLWEKPLLQVLRAHINDLKEAMLNAKALLKAAAKIPKDASHSNLGPTASSNASDGGETQTNVIPPAEEGIKKRSAQLSIKLSCEIAEMAMRIENHTLERQLSLLYPVRKRTAALQTSLSAAMGVYATMHETAVARALAKRSEKTDRTVVKETELPTDVEDRMSRSIVAHDMCASVLVPCSLQYIFIVNSSEQVSRYMLNAQGGFGNGSSS